MKKKGILTAALALVLTVSPFGGMNVSAEEGGEVSAQAESRATESATEVLRLGALKDVKFSEDLMRCCFSFPTVEYGRYMAHIKVYRDGELFKEYDTRRDDSSPWNIYLKQGENNGSHLSHRAVYPPRTGPGHHHRILGCGKGRHFPFYFCGRRRRI